MTNPGHFTRRSSRQHRKSLRQRESEELDTSTALPHSSLSWMRRFEADDDVEEDESGGKIPCQDSETEVTVDGNMKANVNKSFSEWSALRASKTPPDPKAQLKIQNDTNTSVPVSIGAPPVYPKPKSGYLKKVKIAGPPYDEDEGIETQTESKYNLPPFTPDTFMIYAWPRPRPRHILNLSDNLRAWKTRQDKVEAVLDVDDGSDDWDEFSGNVRHYPGRASMHTAMARTFVNRAKRAFRAGKAWEEFVVQETVVDPPKAALQEKVKRKRNRALEDVLDNHLRMVIFDKIAERLCNEIWLEMLPNATGGRLRSDETHSRLRPEQMSRAELQADLVQLKRLQRNNQHRLIGGIRGMTGLETIVSLWEDSSEEDSEQPHSD